MFIQQKILLTESECDKILDLTDSIFYPSLLGSAQYIPSKRKSHTHNLKIKKGDWLFSLIEKVFKEINVEISVKRLNIPVLRYSEGDVLFKHTDNYEGALDRYYVGIFNLSEGYDGGDLLVYDYNDNPTALNKIKGNVGFFYANQFHEVTKVISGTRYVAVVWLALSEVRIPKSVI